MPEPARNLTYGEVITDEAAKILAGLPPESLVAWIKVQPQLLEDPVDHPRTRAISSRTGKIFLYSQPRPPLEVLYEIDSRTSTIYFMHFSAPQLLSAPSRSRRASTPADPLASLAQVIAATSDLRSSSGRLSAKRVAAAFGLSIAELAKQLGRSRQAVSKTDDAVSIQRGLAPFAGISRLRAVLAPEDFRAWLHLPNEQLDGRSPSEVVRMGGVETVAELAEDMLSGSPA